MKGKLLVLALIFSIFSISFIAAESTTSEYYVKTIYVTKVFNDNLGFRVDYQTANMEMQQVYMPSVWFKDPAGYGEVIYGDHPSAPYMSIWYKDNKIDHFRLYVKANYGDPSWGTFARTGVTETEFQVEELLMIY